MKKRVVIVLLTGLVIASLAGCGAKADATDQEVSESSSAETEPDDEITGEEVVGDDTVLFCLQKKNLKTLMH